MSENVFTRVEADDPSRCQATGQHGQCPYRAVGSREAEGEPWIGSKYCPRHGGNKQSEGEKKQRSQMYLAALWQDKIGRQAYHPQYKSLREEMGILRMTLENRLGACKTDQDLLMYSGQITELVREIGKLAKVAHGIEKDLGHLLDKAQAEAWVQEIVGIISAFVSSPDDLQKISEDLIASLEARTTLNEVHQVNNRSA